MNEIIIKIIFSPDKKHRIAELWYMRKKIAELNQENGFLAIEICHFKKMFYRIPLDHFQKAIEDAKNKLISLN